VGPTFPGFAYAAESGSKAVSLTLGEGSSSQKTLNHIYYNGGGHFVIPTPYPANIEILARYADSTPSTPNPIAAVLSRKGKGKALLTSVHAEYPLNDPPARDAIAKLDDVPDQVDLAESESRRIAWMEELLLKLDLKPPGRRKVGSSVEGEEDPNLLLHPTHPSPIFVVSHPNLLRLAPETFNSPAIRTKVMEEDVVTVLRDGNDELRISTVDQPDGQSADADEDLTRYLARRRREQPPQPPTLENLSLDSTTPPAPPPMPDFHIIPKSLLLPSTSTPYSPNWTPLFNIETYWNELDMARKRYGRKTGIMRKDESGNERASVGDLLLYGETVTSTQTMLDRNPIILTHLPTPVAFLASFQLSGRGRGSNIWLSPAGCLQFSLLLTLPSSMSSKIVFIQYLMALAVCEAVDDDGRLGVKVKWPNDIYAECEGVGGTEVGSGKKGLAKLGGILVNTNFVNGQWRVVIGTGINVLNALPTTSISQLHSLLAGRSPKHAINPPTMESTFAKIMNAFEIKWEQFVEDKGFSGFMDEYLGRWLHTYVTHIFLM
jgi:biotin--protein ligase